VKYAPVRKQVAKPKRAKKQAVKKAPNKGKASKQIRK